MKKFILIATALLCLILLSVYWLHYRSNPSLKYVPLSGSVNSYDAISRATGGQTVRIDREKFERGKINLAEFALKKMEQHQYDANIFEAEGELRGRNTRFDFWIDSSIESLSVQVTGLTKKPTVRIFGPQKIEPPGKEIFPGTNGTEKIFEKPVSGLWGVEIRDADNARLLIEAKTSISIENPRPVAIGGRPGHQGYFPDPNPLVHGKYRKFEIPIFSDHIVFKEVIIQLISRGGKVLEKKMAGNEPDFSADSIVDLKIPKESFKILFLGTMKDGSQVQRMSQKLFEVH